MLDQLIWNFKKTQLSKMQSGEFTYSKYYNKFLPFRIKNLLANSFEK